MAPQPLRRPPPAAPLDRYQLVRELGRGVTGVVHEALDRTSGRVVALKMLANPGGLLDLKREFRAAAGLAHPNLVALHDLVLDRGSAFFTMELVAGVDWRAWVREPGPAPLDRLLSTLGQVLDGLGCLHAAGIVHRDLKPANVLVTDAGCAKILDFGTALDVRHDALSAARRGTPYYMSPEQLEGAFIGPASDLYSVGAILWELLVGVPPFVGAPDEVGKAHRYQAPRPPSSAGRKIPRPLERFCMRLLAKDPAERFLSAADARRALEITCGAPAASARARAAAPPPRADRLYGRAAEVAQLSALIGEVQAGAARFALVTGPSGIGKTALAEAALDEAERAGFLVLRGACREHEAVAHNAFDPVADEVAERLAGARLSPLDPDLAAIAQLFPVLAPPGRTAPTAAAAPEERREVAYEAVRRAAARAARARPIALHLDDLHWADEDSLALLAHLLRRGGVPGLLVIATAWPDVEPHSHFGRLIAAPPLREATRIALGPLDARAAAALVRDVAGDLPPPATLAAMHRASDGNPFLLQELAHFGEDRSRGERSFRQAELLVQRRLAALTAEEVELVELAAVAPGSPDLALLRVALGSPALLDEGALRRLCALKILRADGDRLDFHHHRIREAIRAEVPPDRRRHYHLRLAGALAEARPDDHGALYAAFTLAGDPERAAAHAEAAADAALAQLAHGRAVELYRAALDHGPAAARLRLRARLAEALEGAGRYADAAAHYRATLPHHDGLDRARLEIQLANCLLHAGAFEESLGLTERCLSTLGHRPRRPGFLRALLVLGLLIANTIARRLARPLRAADGLAEEVALKVYWLAIVHYQIIGKNLEQLEYGLRYVLLGRRSPAPEVRVEGEAMQLILLTPFRHLPRWGRLAADGFARLETLARGAPGERSRSWPSVLRAMHAIVDGRPDTAIRQFAATSDFDIARGGYIALQRRNALFLAAEYDRYIDEVVPEASAACDGKSALATARWAYVLRLRGELKAARRLAAAAAGLPLEEVPWTHRSLLLYQLVELDLLDDDTRAAAFRAAQLVDRIRPAAISPITGAFESLDAVVRAFVAEALRLHRSDPRAAARLLRRARRALRRAPLVCPPLFAPRLAHARAIVALAGGRPRRALALLERAATLAETTHVPACTLRILEDLIHLRAALQLPPGPATERAEALATRYNLPRRGTSAPWLAVTSLPAA